MNVSHQRVIVKVNGQEFLVELGELDATPVKAVVDGQIFEVFVGATVSELRHETSPAVGAQPEVNTLLKPTQEPAAATSPDIIRKSNVIAPLPGDIIEIFVKPGQLVSVGDALCVLDAMKMKNVIYSPRTGRISSVKVSHGQSVDYGAEIVTFE